MKIRKGFSTIEMIMAIFVISLIFSLIFVINYSYDSDFDKYSYKIKADLREYIIKSSNDFGKYILLFSGNKYYIYKRNTVIDTVVLPSDIFVLPKDTRIDLLNTSRFGAPSKGNTIYIYNKKTKNLERITIMLGSGRVFSYKDKYEDNKTMIDILMSNSGYWW